MLSARPKITDLTFHLLARSVHPELFDACVVREYRRENYLLRVNITKSGHLITFVHDQNVLTEISASANQPLPTKRVLISRAINTPRREATVYRDLIDYECSYQLEGVNPKTFVTIQQQLDSQVQYEGLVHRFEANGRIAFGAISYINVQSFNNYVSIRAFHTFPDTFAIMKSESRFSLRNTG